MTIGEIKKEINELGLKVATRAKGSTADEATKEKVIELAVLAGSTAGEVLEFEGVNQTEVEAELKVTDVTEGVLWGAYMMMFTFSVYWSGFFFDRDAAVDEGAMKLNAAIELAAYASGESLDAFMTKLDLWQLHWDENGGEDHVGRFLVQVMLRVMGKLTNVEWNEAADDLIENPLAFLNHTQAVMMANGLLSS